MDAPPLLIGVVMRQNDGLVNKRSFNFGEEDPEWILQRWVLI